MSFGGDSGGAQNTTVSHEEPRVLNLRIQTSAYGLAVPVVWGTNRIPGNMIWYDDFRAIAHTTSTTTSTGGGGGGKGGGGGGGGGTITQTNTTYTYTAATMLALCWGQIAGIGQVWKDKDKVGIGDVGSLFVGSSVQNAWSYLTTAHPTEALAYRDIAYVANAVLDLGSNGSISQYGFEIQGRQIYGSGVVDALPKDIVIDALSNARLGVAFPSDSLGDLTNWANYCKASKFFLSPAVSAQTSAHEFFKDILDATNSEVVWSEGLVKVIPYGDAAVTSSYGSWTPDMTPLYDLDDDDFCPAKGEDPVRIIRKSPADAYNQVQVEYLSRANEYNVTPVERKDQANIEQFGLRAQAVRKLHLICRDDTAGNIADILLRRALYIRNEFEFELSWKYGLLEPMDLVTITDLPQGLDRQLVRIIEVVEKEDGSISIRAEEVPGVTASAAEIDGEVSGGFSVDFNVSPGNTNAPVFFEPPLALTDTPQVWLAMSGGANWGGAEIWLSMDGSSYGRAGTVFGSSKHGVITAALPVGLDPDLANTLKVDLSISGGTLVGGTQLDRDLYNTLAYVGGELVSYQTATLTGPSAYDLASLRRGAYGTTIVNHASGATFVRCDAGVFKLPYTPDYVGKTIYVKLRSFNIYGGGIQDLESLTPYTYTVLGAPIGSVSNLVLEQPFNGPDCAIKWGAYLGASSYRVEVYSGLTLRRSVSNLTAPRYTYTLDAALADGGAARSLEFRVYAVNATGESSAPAILAAVNTQIGLPVGIAVASALTSISVFAEPPTALDYAGTLVWMSTTTGFTPDSLSLVYDGADNYCNLLDLDPNETYYIRMAHYDIFGKDNLSISSEYNANTNSFSGGVEIVSTLPTVGNYEGRIVFLTTDGKLYRYYLGAWTKAVATGDLTGQIVNGQLAANSVTTDNLVAGSVTAAKIAVSTLAAIQAYLGTVYAGTIINDAAGHIRGGQVAFNAGAGYWLGYDTVDGKYKFSLANPSDDSLTFDETGLRITGNLTINSVADSQLIVNNDFAVGLTNWNIVVAEQVNGSWTSETYNSSVQAKFTGTAPGATGAIECRKFAVVAGESFAFSMQVTAPANDANISVFLQYSTDPAFVGDYLYGGAGVLSMELLTQFVPALTDPQTFTLNDVVPVGAVWANIMLLVLEDIV